MRRALALLAIAVMMGGCKSKKPVHEIFDLAGLDVTSSAFTDGAPIPERYTCEGDNLSPPLAWTAMPSDVAAIAIVVEDRDAPRGTFFHWIVVGIPSSASSIEEGKLPDGARLVQTSSEDVGYTGMCPPNGDPAHHYRFEVFGLRRDVSIDPRTAPARAADTILRSATAEGVITGTFKR